VDSHTHLVFAAYRENEFVDRIKGLTYQEIANKSGGILNSAKKLREMPENDLYHFSNEKLNRLIKGGTTSIEIKSGYGLDLDSELKMLRVIKRLKETHKIPIKATFLGAHAYPQAYKSKKDKYLELIINEMIPAVQSEGLADYIDVFCEKDYFSVNNTSLLIEAGVKAGLKPKIHVNQFNALGGIKVAVEAKAISVDHLEEMNEEDYQLLENSDTIATVLPSCSFFLGIPYAPARKMIDRNIAIAIASDYNPGSTPSGNMSFLLSLACIKQGLTPEEAINALTLNAAFALELEQEVGSLAVGKKANFIITKSIPSLAYIPYSFGENCVEKVFVDGEEFKY
jgi:imidazolonepropionase